MTMHPPTSSLADTNPTALGWRIGVLVFLAAAGLYLATAQHGASWQDSGEYQWRIMTGDYLLTGGARSHPLYIAIGQCVYRLAGAEHYCTVLNSLNGVVMAAALATLAAILCRLGVARLGALAIVSVVMLTHAVWWLATITETYPLSVLLLMVELYCLSRLIGSGKLRWLVALAAVNGLHLSVHNIALLGLPVYGLVAIAMIVGATRRSQGSATRVVGVSFATVGAWIVGGGAFWTVVTIQVQRMGFAAGMADCLWGSYSDEVFGTQANSMTWVNFALMGISFAGPLLLLAIVGVVRCFRPPSDGLCKAQRQTSRAILAVMIIEGVFLSRYFVPDQFLFALPTIFTMAILAGVGGQWLMARRALWRRGLPVLLFAWAACQPALLWTGYRLAGQRFDRPSHSAPRDEAAYWILPWKCDDHSTTDWVTGIQTQLDPSIPIRTDGTTGNLLKINGLPTARRNDLPASAKQSYWSIRYPVPHGWQVAQEYPELRLLLIERQE